MIEATDVQLLDLMKKYKSQIIKSFLEAASDYSPTESVSENDILDAVLCQASDVDFLVDVVTSIEDSVGMEDLNFQEDE